MPFVTLIRPFNDAGGYGDWIDVSADVIGNIGNIASDLDNTEYDIGVYRNSNFSLKIDNETGKYSEPDQINSIFRLTRSNSQVRIIYYPRTIGGPQCGIAKCGRAGISEPVIIFTGLLNDEGAKQSLSKQELSFNVLGRESVFAKTIVPFGSIHAFDSFKTVLTALLNQPGITSILRVLPENINPGLNLTIDSITGLQNKTVQEGLNKLLLVSNSVLRIDGDDVIVSPRTPTADMKFTFYGQASNIGPENITDIENITSGFGRIFNYFTWKDTTVVALDADSIGRYGVFKEEVEFDGITDDAKRLQILQALLAEFKEPKQEMHIGTPITPGVTSVGLLSRVNVDYPTIYVPSEIDFPICGVAKFGSAVMPIEEWNFALETTQHFKVIGRSIDSTKDVVKFRVREI